MLDATRVFGEFGRTKYVPPLPPFPPGCVRHGLSTPPKDLNYLTVWGLDPENGGLTNQITMNTKGR